MEIKINKEINNYYEQFFMGLGLRQVLFSLAGIITALVVALELKDKVGMETLSWVIPLCVVPFFFFGYKKVNGMPLEKFMVVRIRSKYLTPHKLVLGNDNVIQMITEDYLKESKKHDQEKEAGCTSDS